MTRERLYIDAMEEVMTQTSKVLIDSKGGNNMLYLPLDQLMRSRSISRETSNLDAVDVDRVADQVLDRIQRNSTRQGEGRR